MAKGPQEGSGTAASGPDPANFKGKPRSRARLEHQVKEARHSRADAAIGHIERAQVLDAPSYALRDAIARPMQIAGRPSHRLRSALHGTRFGHPVHPMLVTVPIGSWTLALGVDLLASLGLIRREKAHMADTALRIGAAGAVAAAMAGLMDWLYTDGRDRRLGLVHAGANGTALALNLVSISLRKGGRTGRGRAVSAAAWTCMAIGGYLGGHLVYRRRVGVDHADRSPEPRAFQPVLALTELKPNQPRRVEVWDEELRQNVGVALVLREGQVHAIGARCSHTGGPLDQGWVLEDTLVCPWHGSRYDLRTGRPVAGPSTCPQPHYRVRVRNGMVEIRREQEPGDEIVMQDTLAQSVHSAEGQDSPAGKKADDVLFEHHEFLRRLFERIAAMPHEDPQRRDLMRTLAAELDIHEHIEDKLFYPAVEPVSEDVQIAHSEHMTLADLLAMTLKFGTTTPEFEEHFKALRAAFNHHARSEEHSMLRHAQRLGDRRLRELGQQLEILLDHERTSRMRRAFYDLKVSLLERGRGS
ncbi:MAG: DUF2231 domain-containing protein [Rhodopila sp.]